MSSKKITRTPKAEKVEEVEVEETVQTEETIEKDPTFRDILNTSEFTAHVSFIPRELSAGQIYNLFVDFTQSCLGWDYNSMKHYINIAFKTEKDYEKFVDYVTELIKSDSKTYEKLKVEKYSRAEPTEKDNQRSRSPQRSRYQSGNNRSRSPRNNRARSPRNNRSRSPTNKGGYRNDSGDNDRRDNYRGRQNNQEDRGDNGYRRDNRNTDRSPPPRYRSNKNNNNDY